MKRHSLLLGLPLALALLCGCAGIKRLVTAEVEITSGTNSIRIRQPKDVTVQSLKWQGIELKGYASSANSEAIAAAQAQAEGMAQVFGAGFEMLGRLATAAAATQGVKLPAVSTPPTTGSLVISNPGASPPPAGSTNTPPRPRE